MAKPRKIILAENNPADVDRTKAAFAKVNIPLEVIHASDGQELLNILRSEYLGNIALVMMNFNIPVISGTEVLKVMYSDDELKKLPIIVFAEDWEVTNVLNCYENGANACVYKPVALEDFNTSIQAIANFWGEINVLPSYNGHEVM